MQKTGPKNKPLESRGPTLGECVCVEDRDELLTKMGKLQYLA